jgi:uncharacterized protein YcbK (DUF882 family)
LTRIERTTNRRRLNINAWPKWLVGFMLAFSFLGLAAPAANAETRTLKLYFVHTKEKAEITYKRNGRYDQSGLNKINKFLRDWRRNEPTKMDPHLLDVVWETYKAVGARDYIHVVSAYRSPATNSMLRKRSKGVANKSQHMLGKAMDFYIPGVSLKKLRDAGLRAQSGGVGYYPRSGSPFVHLDVGNVRHWPRMSRKELVSVFPSGKTLHVPSDGKPLPGFDTALASYNARKKSGSTALALASSGPSKSGGLLSALFGGGADEEEDSSEAETVAVASARPAKAVETREAKASGNIRIVPPEEAAPAIPAEVEAQEQTPEAIIAALPIRDIPLPVFAPRPKADVGAAQAAETVPFGMAAAEAPVPFGMAAAALDDGTQVAAAGEATPFELAANVPLPTWRPNSATPNLTAEEGQSMLLALAAPEPTPRSAALPQNSAAGDQFFVASLPQEGASSAPLPQSVPALIEKAEAVEAQKKTNQARLALLTDGASASDPIGARPGAKAAAELFRSGAKTTPKTARAKLKDVRPAPKPLVLAAQPEAARWAIGGGYVTTAGGTVAESVAHHVVRSAPTEVYAAGFQKDPQVADARRFTGRAVSFMPIAHFE